MYRHWRANIKFPDSEIPIDLVYIPKISFRGERGTISKYFKPRALRLLRRSFSLDIDDFDKRDLL